MSSAVRRATAVSWAHGVREDATHHEARADAKGQDPRQHEDDAEGQSESEHDERDPYRDRGCVLQNM
jgi:hypothetical protein